MDLINYDVHNHDHVHLRRNFGNSEFDSHSILVVRDFLIFGWLNENHYIAQLSTPNHEINQVYDIRHHCFYKLSTLELNLLGVGYRFDNVNFDDESGISRASTAHAGTQLAGYANAKKEAETFAHCLGLRQMKLEANRQRCRSTVERTAAVNPALQSKYPEAFDDYMNEYVDKLRARE